MVPITTLQLLFDDGRNLTPARLRGAISEAALQQKELFDEAGLLTDLFHNHNEETFVEGKTNKPPNITRYPLIQYKQQAGKTLITGIGKGAEAIKLWSNNCNNSLQTKSGKKVIAEKIITTHEWEPQLLAKNKNFRIQYWLPLNSMNLKEYDTTIKLAERIKKLDNIIWGHVFRLFDDVGFTPDRKKVFLYIEEIIPVKNQTCYNVEWKTFDCVITTNLNLPANIGLGHGVSLGFGDIQPVTRQTKYGL